MDKPIGDYTLKEVKAMCEQKNGNCNRCLFKDNVCGSLKIRHCEFSEQKYTAADIALMKGLLAVGYKWGAKNGYQAIVFFHQRPRKYGNQWIGEPTESCVYMHEDALQSITWDDPEPTNIEDALKEVEG